MAKQVTKINLPDVIGGGYGDYWRSKKRYRVVKGGRASKKSTTAFTELPYRIMKYPLSNALVVRQTANTHESSTFAELQRGVKRLGVYNMWKFTTNPCEATYKPTGQKILFRGFDDPYKLTSLAVPHGVLCWAYFEEVYEIEDKQAFNTLCEGFRGKDIEDAGLWVQFTLIYNPWVATHWTKEMFWDVERPDTFRLTTTYKDNEFLSQSDIDAIEALNDETSDMYDPERFRVVGLGEYGIAGSAFFPEFRRELHVEEPFRIPEHWVRYTTKDYGLDMLANLWIAVDEEGTAHVYREYGKSDLSISEACEKIRIANAEDNIRLKYAPSDLWSRSHESGRSRADIFRENGESLTQSSRDREAGCMAMKEYLRPYYIKNVETGEKYKTAKLKIFNTCTNLISSITQLRKDQIKPDIYDDEHGTVAHKITHFPDALRYFCVMRHRPTDPIVEKRRDTLRDYFNLSDDDKEDEPCESYIYMQVRGR